LLLSGRNNHNWQATTPILEKLLESTGGKFAVTITVPPRGLTAENLENFDVILSNWNSWGSASQKSEAEWTDATRRAYLDFVRGGKGHVTVHAGGSSFYEGWPEYRKVALVYWDLGTTQHGRPHEFQIRIDAPEHPIAKGFRGFSLHDELWNQPGVVPGATVVASAFSDKQRESRGTDQWEPVVVTANFGRGRCFATLLGHDANVMQDPNFQALLIRGLQWAGGRTVAAP
jgi:type 1 glutamine amidotransferase